MNIIVVLAVSIILGIYIVFLIDMIEYNWRFYRFKKNLKNKKK